MKFSYFDIKESPPSSDSIKKILGSTFNLWEKVSETLSKYGEIRCEWKFYSKQSGWCKKIYINKRNIVFLFPNEELFTSITVLSEKGTEMLNNSTVPVIVKQNLLTTTKHVEGRSLAIKVSNYDDFLLLEKILVVKVQS